GARRPPPGPRGAEGADPPPRREPWQPLLLLVLGPEEHEALESDRLVASDEDAHRGVGRADLFGDAAVGGGREAVSAVGFGDRHPERAQVRETPDDFLRNAMLAVDARRVDMVAREIAEGLEKGRDGLALFRRNLGDREDRLFGDLPGEKKLDGRGRGLLSLVRTRLAHAVFFS